MPLTPRALKELVASAVASPVRDEAAIDQYLDDHGVRDPESRIAFKISLAASGELQTDQTIDFRLATDHARYTPEVAPVHPTMEAWLRKANLRLDQNYSKRDVDEALAGSGLDTLSRMSVRSELYDRGLIRAASASPRQVQAGRGREMSARAADRPRRILTDASGKPRTLVSFPD